jgi:GNAT superfamily N-acetyltransferase
MAGAIRIRCLEILGDRELTGLCDVLVDCVEGGASVSFMLPMSRAKAEAFWQQAALGMVRGERAVLVAEDAGGAIVGTVSVAFAAAENQPHRGDLTKMLVSRRARRMGVGAALLAAAEAHARRVGRSLLVLDAVTGGDGARLYARHGWQRCGDIPHYALMPDGAPCSTTYFYKQLVE